MKMSPSAKIGEKGNHITWRQRKEKNKKHIEAKSKILVAVRQKYNYNRLI